MKVKEFMTSTIVAVMADLTVGEAARRMLEGNVGILPVCNQDCLCGVITDRDIVVRVVAAGGDPFKIKVRDVMTHKPVVCDEEDEIRDVAKLMKLRRVRRVPVVSRREGLVGMLSLGDFVKSKEGEGLAAEVLEAVAVRHGERRGQRAVAP